MQPENIVFSQFQLSLATRNHKFSITVKDPELLTSFEISVNAKQDGGRWIVDLDGYENKPMKARKIRKLLKEEALRIINEGDHGGF